MEPQSEQSTQCLGDNSDILRRYIEEGVNYA
jgi:hypothetical protein